MTLQRIEIPDSITKIPLSERAIGLIDAANERIEAFMLADQSVIENFVTYDFELLEQSLGWIEQNHLLTGSRFFEAVFDACAANGGLLLTHEGREGMRLVRKT